MIRPTKNRVVVEEIVDHNPGGIIHIVQTALPDVCQGRVLAVGPIGTEVNVGDVVHYSRRCGRPLPDGSLLLEYDMLEAHDPVALE